MVPARSPINEHRRPQGQQARDRGRPARQELAAAAGAGAPLGPRPAPAGDHRLRRAAAVVGKGAAGRARRDADVLEFLRRSRRQGLSARHRDGWRHARARRQGAGRDRRLHLRRCLGGAQQRRRSTASSTPPAGEADPRHLGAEWQRLAPRIGVRDAAALSIYRQRYGEGIVRRPLTEEEADARALYCVLAEIGGTELVGPARELDPGTFYRPAQGNEPGAAARLARAAHRGLVHRLAVRRPTYVARPANGRAHDHQRSALGRARLQSRRDAAARRGGVLARDGCWARRSGSRWAAPGSPTGSPIPG